MNTLRKILAIVISAVGVFGPCLVFISRYGMANEPINDRLSSGNTALWMVGAVAVSSFSGLVGYLLIGGNATNDPKTYILDSISRLQSNMEIRRAREGLKSAEQKA